MNLLRKRPERLAAWLIAGNVCLALALVLMTAVSLHGHRQIEEERARDVVDNLAQGLAVEVGAELRNADNALSTVALRFRSARASEDHNDTVSRILAEQQGLLPQVSALRIADIRGHVATGLDKDERPFSIADRDYFTQAMMSTGMVISEPLQGRVNKQWSIIVARRLINHDGQFSGVVFAVMTAQHFVDRFSTVALGPSGAVALRSGDLNLIARYSAMEPGSTKGFGAKNLSEQLKLSLAQSRERGSYLTPTALDQIERITAYRRVPGYDLTLFTGMSSGYYLAPWWQQVWQQSLLAALVWLAAVGASWMLYRHQRGERRSRQALYRLAREQDLMLNNDLIGMVRVRDGRAVWGNPALERMFGYVEGELTGQRTELLFMNDDEHQRTNALGAAAIRAGHRFKTQLRMRRKDGSALWVDLSGMVLSDAESLWMLVDIDALKQSEEQAHTLALRDGLTNLPNRRLFEEKLGDVINASRRSGEGFAICYLDLDGFKPINDQYGHDAGDEVLIQIGTRLQQLLRGNDVVARLGGDEFGILLSGINHPVDVEEVLKRALFSIQRRITLEDGTRVTVNASVGAVMGTGGDTGRDLMRAADETMYDVKRSGKGRFRVAVSGETWAAAA